MRDDERSNGLAVFISLSMIGIFFMTAKSCEDHKHRCNVVAGCFQGTAPVDICLNLRKEICQ